MSGEIIDISGRSADQIAIEICTIRDQVATTAMVGACQIGKRLEEAKRLVAFGDWGDYIKNRIGYSQSQVDNLMRLYRKYGEFGPNSQSIANLTPTAALKLLALPDDERESFAESHDVAAMSVRELEAAIKAHKDRAEKAEEDVLAQKELLAIATEENGALKQRLESIDADYKAQLDTVDRENDELREKLAAAEAKGAEVPAEEADRLRKEGADRQAQEDRERIVTAEGKAAALAREKDAEIEQLRAMLEKARKDVPTGITNPNYGAFKAAFESLVPAFQQVCKYAVLAADTPEQVTANRNAIKGLLLKLGGLADREVTVV